MQPEFVWTILGQEIHVHAYALFTVLGASAACLAALPLLRRERLRRGEALGLLACLVPAFLVGARLFNYVVNTDAYGGSLRLFSLRLAGFSMYGGILGVLAALLLWSVWKRREAWSLLDAMVLPGAAAFAFARVGCFYNGCCGGVATASSLGLYFPLRDVDKSPIYNVLSMLGQSTTPRIKVYPTQLFELVLALVLVLPIVWFYLRGKLPSGGAFLLYAAAFSAMRLAVLPLRSLPYPDVVTAVVYPLLYGSLIVVCLAWFVRRRRNTRV